MSRRRLFRGRRKELKLQLKTVRAENRQLRIETGVTLARAMTVLYAVKTVASIVSIFSFF